MSELKPCPCCDADTPFKRAIPEVGIPSGDSGYRVTIKCRDCGCTITRWALKKAWAIESAEAAWNRRIQPANSRFANCHIWEPGDKLDTLSDKCDVLIKAADIKALMQPTTADRIPGACEVDKAAHRVFMAAEGREGICWRPSGVKCKTCDAELETCYCEERLYMVRCQKCEKVVLVKSRGPRFAAEEAGHAQ